MDAELEKYKEKISNYCIEELEEILISLNKDKFPEKYELVKSFLAEKIQNKLGPSIKSVPEIKTPEEKKEPEKIILKEEKQQINYEKVDIESTEHKTNTIAQIIFSLIVVLSSIFAAYILLMANYNLPGKKIIIDTCKSIPIFSSSNSLKSEKVS